jgi:diaminopimelate epimerase
MKFTKMQGAGNDFVVIKTGNNIRNWSKLAIEICNRHYGVGADGLLLFLPSNVADFKMRLFNADGSESSACGNGMRCLVKLFLDEHSDNKNDYEVTIETAAGIRQARVHHQQGDVKEIHANMGQPRVGHNGTPAQIIKNKAVSADTVNTMNRIVKVNGEELLLSLVTIGNPHAVHFIRDSVADFPLTSVGPRVEQHRLFPDETNFEVARVINRKIVVARVWERGVGETFACGTGACAITIAGNLLGYLDRKVKIKLPGGTLNVEWDSKGEVYLGGPAATVFHGDWR